MINLRISDNDGNFFIACKVIAIFFNKHGELLITYGENSSIPKSKVLKVEDVSSLEFC